MAELNFAALCVPLQRAMHLCALRLTCDRTAADELLQVTYLRALEHWKRFKVAEDEDPVDRAGAWLHRIMVNQHISDCRRDKARAAREWRVPGVAGLALEDSIGALPSHEPAPDEQRLSPATIAALEALDPVHREIVLRFDLGGDSYQEIAGSLGVAVGTVKSRLSRARDQLACALS